MLSPGRPCGLTFSPICASPPRSLDLWSGCNSTTETGGEVSCLSFATYTWFAAKTSSAANVGERQTDASPEELMAACDANQQCAGFTTDGWLKAAGGELVEFDGAGTCDGFYAAQLDNQGEANITLVAGWLPVFGSLRLSAAVSSHRLCTRKGCLGAEASGNLLSVAIHTSAPLPPRPSCSSGLHRPAGGYPFFPQQNSQGSDMEPKLSGTPQQMADQCSATPGCLAFTSDGVMKSAVKEALDPLPDAGPCGGIYIATAGTGTGGG